jgi:hypothetical protein
MSGNKRIVAVCGQVAFSTAGRANGEKWRSWGNLSGNGSLGRMTALHGGDAVLHMELVDSYIMPCVTLFMARSERCGETQGEISTRHLLHALTPLWFFLLTQTNA